MSKIIWLHSSWKVRNEIWGSSSYTWTSFRRLFTCVRWSQRMLWNRKFDAAKKKSHILRTIFSYKQRLIFFFFVPSSSNYFHFWCSSFLLCLRFEIESFLTDQTMWAVDLWKLTDALRYTHTLETESISVFAKPLRIFNMQQIS